MSSVARTEPGDPRGTNTGWIIGGLLVVLVCAVMGGFWFAYHPL